MKRIISIITSAFVAASLLLIAIGVAPVAASQGQCPGAHVQMYEDSGYGGARFDICYSGASPTHVSDFRTLTLNYRCDRYFPVGGSDALTFNDCMSSYKLVGSNCHIGARFYIDTGYNSLWGLGTRYGNESVSSLALAYNDAVSSFEWTYRSTCPMTAT